MSLGGEDGCRDGEATRVRRAVTHPQRSGAEPCRGLEGPDCGGPDRRAPSCRTHPSRPNPQPAPPSPIHPAFIHLPPSAQLPHHAGRQPAGLPAALPRGPPPPAASASCARTGRASSGRRVRPGVGIRGGNEGPGLGGAERRRLGWGWGV